MKSELIMRILYLLLFICSSVYADKPVTLVEILKPVDIDADAERLYVAEKTSVCIYSLKDFKLIKKFGRRGDGPGEFRTITGVFPGSDTLYVSGVKKLYFFSKDGTYKKMLKTTSFIPLFDIFGDKFLGRSFVTTEKVYYSAISILDSNLKQERELYRQELENSLKPISGSLAFWGCDNKIFINGEDDKIHCFNDKGEEIRTITPKIKKIKVTGEVKKRYVNYFKDNPKKKAILAMYNNRIDFPKYYPAIKYFLVADEKLYVITYAKTDGKFECQVLDLDGKLLKKAFLPIISSSLTRTYSFIIKNGKLYQLVENEDEETWELHVTTI